MPESRDTEGLPKEAPWPVRRGLTASCSACMITSTLSAPNDTPSAPVAQRVIVCGSRTWDDEFWLASRLAQLPAGSVIVQGGARGADRIAQKAARRLGFKVERFPADWETHGKAAGPIRNQQMLDAGADLVLAFWDGDSRGTQDMVTRAKLALVPVEIIYPRKFAIVREGSQQPR